MKSFKAVIFDLDGTLANTLEDIADSANRTFEKLNFPTYSYKEYKYLVGSGLKVLVEKALPEKYRKRETIDSTYDLLIKDYSEHYINKTKLYGGIPELLDYLMENDYGINILSNKADPITQKICSSLFGKWKFGNILGMSGRFPKKPDPTSALYIAGSLNIKAEEFLYFGDTGIDMKTAKAAGMYGIGVCWGFRTKKELCENGAKITVESPGEIIELLKKGLTWK